MANAEGGNIVWNLDVDDKKFKQGLSQAKSDSASAASDIDSSFSKMSGAIGRSFENAKAASFQFAAGLLAVGAAGIGALGFGVKMAADLETMTQGFVTLLGSTEKANAAINMIKKDAASTPFELPGLINANQLLTSVTKDADRSERLLLNVGKALTAMGKGQPELDRIVVNLQQIGAVGKASMIDIRQFAFAGVPIFDMLNEKFKQTKTAVVDNSKAIGDNTAKLADLRSKLSVAQQQQKEFTDKTKESTRMISNNKISDYTNQIAQLTGKTAGLADQNGKLTKSQGQLEDAISSGAVTFEVLEDLFNKAGEGTGRFAKAFELQGGTFNQVLSNFKDNIGITMAEVVKQTGLFDFVKKQLSAVTVAIGELAKPETIQKIVGVFQNLSKYLPVVAGAILGALVPAFVALAISVGTAVLSLLPFIVAGAALAVAAKFIIDRLGGWSAATDKLNAGFKLFGDAYNTYVKPSVDQLGDQLKEVMPMLQQIWKLIEPAIIPALETLAKIIGIGVLVSLKLFIIQLQIWVEIFKRAYNAVETMVDFVKSLEKPLTDLKDWFIDTKNTVSDFTIETTKNLQNWATNAKGSFETFIQNSQSTLTRWGNNIQQALQPWRDNFLGTLGSVLTEAGNRIYQWDLDRLAEYRQFGVRVGQALIAGSGAISSAVDTFFTNTLPAWINGFAKWGEAVLTYFLITLPAQIKNSVISAGAAMQSSIDTLFSTTIPAWLLGLQKWADSVHAYFTTTLPEQVKTDVGNLWTSVTAGIGTIWANVQAWWTNLGTQSSESISTGFVNSEPSMAGKIVGTLLKVIGLVLLTLVVGFIEVGIRGGVTLATNIANGISQGIPLVVNTINGLFATIRDMFTTLITQAYDWGKNLLHTFGDGIKAAIQDLLNSVSSALDSAKRLLKGNSPPVEGPFKNIDQWGYNVGRAWTDGVSKAIDQMGGQLMAVNPLATPGLAYAGNMATGGSQTQSNDSSNKGVTVNINEVNVVDQSDIVAIGQQIGFRVQTSPGFTENG